MVTNDKSTPRLSSYDVERQIRIERNLAISAFLRDVVRALARRLYSLALWSIGLVRRLAAEGRRRRPVHQLQRFDDRTLADIGVTRGEIEFVVRNGRPPRLVQTTKAPRPIQTAKAPIRLEPRSSTKAAA